jgi:type IV secretory pathway component VirB8
MNDSSEQAEVTDAIRSGAYFEQSRDWYRTIYIGPIPERTFFLIIALLAGLVAVGSVIALMAFLPITERPPIVLANNQINDVVPQISHIKPNKSAPLNPALMNFFVLNYVTIYETYNAKDYAANFNFIQAHSDAATFAQYATAYGSTNPQSPAAILGATGERDVTIDSIDINDKVDPHTAKVNFTTELVGIPTANKTRWTATIQFYYSDLTVTEGKDPTTGETTTTIKDPQFQVVNYAVSQIP